MRNCICWETQLSLKVMGKSVLQDLGRGFVLSQDIRIKGEAWWLSGKESACNSGDVGLIPGSGRSPKEMATHSSIFAWEIPWIGEPGRLQFMGSQKSLRKLSKQTTATFYNLKRIYHFASPILKDKV